MVDGYPRWEDAFGRFATAKLSASAKAAIGRTLAGYRRYERAGSGILDVFKSYFTDEHDNPAEPRLVESEIPPAYFEDAHLLHLEYDDSIRFIDVEHPRTRNTLKTLLAGPLEALNVTIDDGLSQNRDRRVTRLVISTLHDICRDQGYQHIVGIRYRAPEPDWEAYVLWNHPPPPVDLSTATVDPIFPDAEDLIAAAESLGVSVPGS